MNVIGMVAIVISYDLSYIYYIYYTVHNKHYTQKKNKPQMLQIQKTTKLKLKCVVVLLNYRLCDCDYSLWFNGECNVECNTTECLWDFYECMEIDTNDTCNSYNSSTSWDSYNLNISSSNLTTSDIIDSIPCYTSWVGDTWCDISCNTANCNYDDGSCDGCLDRCEDIYGILNSIPLNGTYGNNVFTKDTACPYADLLFQFANDNDFETDNCSLAFDIVDINGNGFVGWWEAIQFAPALFGLLCMDHWEEKMLQVDCSLCLDNPDYWYW